MESMSPLRSDSTCDLSRIVPGTTSRTMRLLRNLPRSERVAFVREQMQKARKKKEQAAKNLAELNACTTDFNAEFCEQIANGDFSPEVQDAIRRIRFQTKSEHSEEVQDRAKFLEEHAQELQEAKRLEQKAKIAAT
ncbi:MAG: hypothetical protein MHM6MM_009325, partial [Cercozoa sp. M6MM]